jgi:hypothetical protein
LSLLLMLACMGLLVDESDDAKCTGQSRLDCIRASLGGGLPVKREWALPVAAVASVSGPTTAGRADPLFSEIWIHRATSKNDQLELREPPRRVSRIVAMLSPAERRPTETSRAVVDVATAKKIAALEASRPIRALAKPAKKKKKAKLKRPKPQPEEFAFSAAKQVPAKHNFSGLDALPSNNAARTPDW